VSRRCPPISAPPSSAPDTELGAECRRFPHRRTPATSQRRLFRGAVRKRLLLAPKALVSGALEGGA